MNNILGAIIGDIIGSVYEWSNAERYDDITLFKTGCRFTDDTVMTCAVAKWLTDSKDLTKTDSKQLCNTLREFGKKYPSAGYGGMFRKWLFENDSNEPFGSFGNGSAMRCSATAYIANSLEEAIDLAKKSAEVTHNHPEGIKGAMATSAAIFMARKGATKQQIKNSIENMFGYKLGTKVDEIRGTHKFDATCQITVPEAINAFLEGETFEEVIKKAIWIGGDSDTIAAIAGSIAAAYYGIPERHIDKCFEFLPKDLKEIIINFTKKINDNILK